MGVLTNGQLSRLRRAVESTFDQTGTIYEPPAPSLSDRGQAPDADYPGDWTAIATDAPCLFYPTQNTPRELAASGQVQSRAEFQAVFAWDITRPTEAAKVRIDGLDYEIAGIGDISYKVATILDLTRAK